MGYVIVGFICLAVGSVIGWCLRVGMENANAGTRPLPEAGHGFIARWE